MRKSEDVYLHLVPVEVWERQLNEPSYVPEAYGRDGFIHCTIGDERMVEVANMFYTGDPRPMIVLSLDPAKISSPVRFEDPESVFPHIHGPLNHDAVSGSRPISRDDDGRFVAIPD